MTGLTLLLLGYCGYCALLGWLAPTILPRARWVIRAPHLAIGLWHALSVSFLASLILAGLAPMRPWLPYGTPATPQISSGPTTAVLGAAIGGMLVSAVVMRVGYTFTRDLLQRRRKQRWHATALAFTGRIAPELGAIILDQDTPAIYCLPGPRHRRRTVVTTGALHALTPDQLDAALAHEHAHLTRRHHLVIASAHALARAFPGVPLFRYAHREIAILAEMAADDVARRHHDARTLAGALVGLATASMPAHALGAGGHTVIRRLDRILNPPPPLALPARAAATSTAAAALAAPVALACTAVVAALSSLAAALLLA